MGDNNIIIIIADSVADGGCLGSVAGVIIGLVVLIGLVLFAVLNLICLIIEMALCALLFVLLPKTIWEKGFAINIITILLTLGFAIVNYGFYITCSPNDPKILMAIASLVVTFGFVSLGGVIGHGAKRIINGTTGLTGGKYFFAVAGIVLFVLLVIFDILLFFGTTIDGVTIPEIISKIPDAFR